jgi:predicted regulator of Ras-like GTPase activity (Roadblock/LC7/MglB family)
MAQDHESITKEQYDQTIENLNDLTDRCALSTVLLVNSAGRVLAEQNRKPGKFETTILSTLASGGYSAAAEMARRLGEQTNFKMVLYEGEKINTFISSVAEDYFLVVVFETGVALGMVRLLVKRTLKQLNEILMDHTDRDFTQLFDEHFQNLLHDRLSSSFMDE